MNRPEEIIFSILRIKFGEENFKRILELVNKLINEDVLIGGKKASYLENLSSVKIDDISKTLDFLFELSGTSYFAAAFFIEKIPLLYFYDLFDDYITLLSLTRHYSSRSVAYALGSSDLISNDLALNVKTINIKIYKKSLSIIIKKHAQLNILSLHIVRHLGKILSAFDNKDLIKFLDICIKIRLLYGNDCAIAYLDNIQIFLREIPLEKVLATLLKLSKVSREYLLFAINYPEIINNKTNKFKSNDNIARLKTEILKNNDYVSINNYPMLLQDKYFLALLMSWKKYPQFHKVNIINQLESTNFKNNMLKNKKISNEINEINSVTENNWFKNWAFADKQIDNKFIYEELRKILLPSCYFKYNTKRIYNEQKEYIENLKIDPKTNLLISFINYLINICIDKEISDYLKSLKDYLRKPSDLFLKKYSDNNLFVKTWDRDPAVDYARSDELYACTSIGEATDFYATVYLADCINSNLDIYNNNLRIGRIHLFLVKNELDETILLVDCIDGSDRLMRNMTRLNYLLESIKTFSRFVKITKIFFNTDLMFNNTPKLFIKFLKSKFIDEEYIYIKRYISNPTQKKLMPFPLISFTESLKDKNEGLVKGFLINNL
jgi:hypothetical protein